MIYYLEENRIFVLETENTHYVFGIDRQGIIGIYTGVPSVTGGLCFCGDRRRKLQSFQAGRIPPGADTLWLHHVPHL